MGILKALVRTTTLGVGTVAASFGALTLGSTFVPISPLTDELFKTSYYAKYNPNNNPTLHDVCVKKVPLSKIKPELLEKKGSLVEVFCAGVWGGAGYHIQRLYLANKYKGPTTSHQLWNLQDLKNSSYEVGTQITDHFEVIDKTPDRIVVRCGDSPLKKEVRPSDGLFAMGVAINNEEAVAEFSLKSVFYQGLGKSNGTDPPMPAWMAFLHRQYARIWIEFAVRNCMN
ncbi:hypothetical protein EDC01DRAFT_649469 [Geopyxis carbonaria]|nr:hypothetical protein EDC01DRAFT_649469 [Geopyxis carbonaria]